MAMALRSAVSCTAAGARATRVARPAVKPALRSAGRVAPSRGVATKVGVEVAQVAGEAGFIAGTALTMFGMTLLGLAVGFVLLRVEALAEADN